MNPIEFLNAIFTQMDLTDMVRNIHKCICIFITEKFVCVKNTEAPETP